MSNNVSVDEVNKFTDDKAQWWDEHGPLRTLHHINPVRVEYIDSKVSLNESTVLDVGCGGGILAEALTLKGAAVTAIDANPSAIATACEHASQRDLNIDYQTSLVEEFAVNHPQKFDVVTCLELLEHVPDPASVISACAKCLKPGGKLFLSTINRTPKAYLLAVVAAEYLLGLIPKKTHDYDKFILPSELNTWLNASQLNLSELRGMSYNPLTKKASLTKDTSVNYLMLATKSTL